MPSLPDSVLDEVIPGTIRNAELFVRYMKSVVTHLKVRPCGASTRACVRAHRLAAPAVMVGRRRRVRQTLTRSMRGVESETALKFMYKLSEALSIDTKPLKFAYTRLNSLLRTLEVTDVDQYMPLQLVADFVTLLATYDKSGGFMLVKEPFHSMTPHIPDPILQLCCLGA